MKLETLEAGNKIASQIKVTNEKLVFWGSLNMDRLLSNSDLVPESIFESFRSALINSLKVRRAELERELENLQDPVEANPKVVKVKYERLGLTE